MFDERSLQNLKKLCRIESTPKEDQELLHSLKRILGYIDLLNEVPTDGVEPVRFLLGDMQKSSLREDVPADPLPRETFLANAPEQIGGMIRVPPVLK